MEPNELLKKANANSTNLELIEARRDFFKRLLGWGIFSKETRLVIVGIRDGGLSLADFCETGVIPTDADTRTVPGFYICKSVQTKSSITERMQCQFSMDLQTTMGLKQEETNLDQYYNKLFLNRFEVVANILPLAKPTEMDSFNELFQKPLGFKNKKEVNMFSEKSLTCRLSGLNLLLAKLKTQKSSCVMLIMGFCHRLEVIKALGLESHRPHPKFKDLDETSAVFKDLHNRQRPSVHYQDNVAICLTGHPAARGTHWQCRFDEDVSKTLAKALTPFLNERTT